MGQCNFAILEAVPSVITPSNTAVYYSSTNSYICASGTVSVGGFLGVAGFVGRIISVNHSDVMIASHDAMTHLFMTSPQCPCDGFLKIQLYLQKDIPLQVTNSCDWPGELTCPSACAGLDEVAVTNLVVCISAAQVDCIVFVPHLDECKNQIWGLMCGRADCYFIQSTLLFGEDIDQYFFTNLPANQYSITHSLPQDKPPSAFTERILELLYFITHQNTKLLTCTVKIPSKVDSKFFLPRESFEHISNQPQQCQKLFCFHLAKLRQSNASIIQICLWSLLRSQQPNPLL